MTKLERFGLVSLAEAWRRRARELEARARQPNVALEDRQEMEGRAAALEEAARELLEAMEAV